MGSRGEGEWTDQACFCSLCVVVCVLQGFSSRTPSVRASIRSRLPLPLVCGSAKLVVNLVPSMFQSDTAVSLLCAVLN